MIWINVSRRNLAKKQFAEISIAACHSSASRSALGSLVMYCAAWRSAILFEFHVHCFLGKLVARKPALGLSRGVGGNALHNGVVAFRALKRSDLKTGTSRCDARQRQSGMTPRTTHALECGERDT
jgi:hypothetical protein